MRKEKDVIIRPIISEKFTRYNERADRYNAATAGKPRKFGRGEGVHPTRGYQYAFVVNTRANKIEIKKAIQDIFNVSVDSVRVQNYIGKIKYRYTKRKATSGRVNAYKKAIITVKAGDEIDFYANI